MTVLEKGGAALLRPFALLFLAVTLLVCVGSAWGQSLDAISAEANAHQATHTVCPSGCDYSTIANALAAANNGDLIDIAFGDYTESNLIINKDVTIQGGDVNATRIQAASAENTAGAGRIFVIQSNTTVTIRDLTLRHGVGPADLGGGAILLHGTLHLEDVKLYRNHAGTQNGGALAAYGAGQLTTQNVVFSDNSAGFGGAVLLLNTAATLSETTFLQNSAIRAGGALYNGTQLQIDNSTFSFNIVTADTPGSDGGGGAIYSQETTSITDSIFSYNSAKSHATAPGTGIGGALRLVSGGIADDSFTLTRVDIYANQAGEHGGAIELSESGSNGTLTISDSEINNNTTFGTGGGISVDYGTLFLDHSTVAVNASATGGGLHIASDGIARVDNSTISTNQSFGSGGGVYAQAGAIVSLSSTTIANNRANSDEDGGGFGGGVYRESGAGIINIANTIIADNVQESGGLTFTFANDCFGTLLSLGYNLIESLGTTINGTPCTTSPLNNLIGVSPELDTLKDNGGLTRTHALLAFSPANNSGNPNGCTTWNGFLLDNDQRGYGRAGRCDIGAYERDAAAPTAVSLSANWVTAARGSHMVVGLALLSTVWMTWAIGSRWKDGCE